MKYQPIGRLKHPTLVFTLGAVFISLPGVDNIIGELHNLLLNTYPNYQRFDIEAVQQLDMNRTVNILQVTHAFSSPDRTEGFSISHDRILFYTTQYEGFNLFGDKFSELLTIIQSKTNLAYHTGVAFRHIDNIRPLDNAKPLSAAIEDKFLTPIIPEVDGGQQHSRHEYLYDLESKRVIFRLYNFDTNSGPEIPGDLFPSYHALKEKPVVNVAPPYVLADFEASYITVGENRKFEVKTMISEMNELHKLASSSFRKIIRPEELEARR